MPASNVNLIDASCLRQHVEQLCGTPRPAGSAALKAARSYATQALEKLGWEVVPDPFSTRDAEGRPLAGINLVAVHKSHPLGAGPRLSVGAHLDSRAESPGADDNGSAVAALLEIARCLPEFWPDNPKLALELVLYDLEENGMLGGAHRAAQMQAAGVDLKGMVSLEMLGYCSHAPNSQALPRTLVGLYPSVGNFIAIIGNQISTRLIEEYRAGMSVMAGLPIETLQVPHNGNLLQATRLSDHSPFWDAGFPALMITDTSFLRNPHYHLASDTADTLDYEFLTRVANGSLHAVRRLIASGV